MFMSDLFLRRMTCNSRGGQFVMKPVKTKGDLTGNGVSVVENA